MAGVMDVGPEAATEEGKARGEKGRAGMAALAQYLAELIQGYIESPARACSPRWCNDDGPDGPMAPREAVANASLLLVAGHDSTVNTISHCVLTRAAEPRVLRACCAAGPS